MYFSILLFSVEKLPDWYQQCLDGREIRSFSNGLRRSSSALRNSIDEETQFLSNSTSAIRLASYLTELREQLDHVIQMTIQEFLASISFNSKDAISVYRVL